MTDARAFWNRFADRYAARPLKDPAAYEAMLQATAACLRPGDRVLEIGCGTGGTAIRLAAGVAQVVATDLSDDMIRIARAKAAPANLRFERAEAGRLADGGPFDAVCAFNVLHLVDDLPALLGRLHEGMAPDGLLICKTWYFGDMGLRWRLLFRALRLVGLFPPARFLTEAGLQDAIAAAGFSIIDRQVFGGRSANPWLVARRNPGNDA
jgi:cyclopropane fatty-acyl-phospholipid synthase-like methyltransferase